MIRKFKSFISENQLIRKSDRVLLAISGGMDSMAMAELFSGAGYNFAIVHCNFKLRGKDADADERLVEAAAGRYGVGFFSGSFNTKAIAKDRGDSIQMAARDLRYAFFEEIAAAHDFNYIATAHQLDDQIETFFINLTRGCGIAGLHGIRLKQGKIIRPMMFAYRADIEEYVKENNIPFREDSSNQSLTYMRNKIRHELMPNFLEMNPAFSEEMTGNIARLAETEVVFRQFISKTKAVIVHKEEDVTAIDIQKLKELEPLKTFLYEFISEFGFKKEDIGNIIPAMDGIPGKMFFSASHQLLIDRKKILITKLTREDEYDLDYMLNREDLSLSKPVKLKISMNTARDYDISPDPNIASLDFDKLAFPLMLRRWKAGDLFIPLGMKNRKKLSDFFIDEKFSRLQKEQTWVLCSGSDVVWVVGSRIDDRYRITPETRDVYRIELD